MNKLDVCVAYDTLPHYSDTLIMLGRFYDRSLLLCFATDIFLETVNEQYGRSKAYKNQTFQFSREFTAERCLLLNKELKAMQSTLAQLTLKESKSFCNDGIYSNDKMQLPEVVVKIFQNAIVDNYRELEHHERNYDFMSTLDKNFNYVRYDEELYTFPGSINLDFIEVWFRWYFKGYNGYIYPALLLKDSSNILHCIGNEI